MNERRLTERHVCPNGPRRQLFRTGFQDTLDATITDLSKGGLGLLTSTYLEPGRELMIEVLSRAHPQRHVERLEIVRSEAVGPEEWRTGCAFVDSYDGTTDERESCSNMRDMGRGAGSQIEDRCQDDSGR